MKRVAALVLVIAPSLGAQSKVVPSDSAIAFAHRIAGCYRLDDGPWRADSVRAGDISTKYTPLAFELSEQLLAGWDAIQSSDRPMFAVWDSAGHVNSPFQYWRRQSWRTDSIVVSNPMSLAGVALQLAPNDGDLGGLVTAFTDAIEEDKPSEVSRPVHARRVPCAAR